jgi:hypothetical protein
MALGSVPAARPIANPAAMAIAHSSKRLPGDTISSNRRCGDRERRRKHPLEPAGSLFAQLVAHRPQSECRQKHRRKMGDEKDGVHGLWNHSSRSSRPTQSRNNV